MAGICKGKRRTHPSVVLSCLSFFDLSKQADVKLVSGLRPMLYITEKHSCSLHLSSG